MVRGAGLAPARQIAGAFRLLAQSFDFPKLMKDMLGFVHMTPRDRIRVSAPVVKKAFHDPLGYLGGLLAKRSVLHRHVHFLFPPRPRGHMRYPHRSTSARAMPDQLGAGELRACAAR